MFEYTSNLAVNNILVDLEQRGIVELLQQWCIVLYI